MIVDVLLRNPTVKNIIQSAGFIQTKVNVFRYQQSLDDSTLIFWRPFYSQKEWSFIYFLKLVEGKVIANLDLGAAIERIDIAKVNHCINVLEMANKSFLYVQV